MTRDEILLGIDTLHTTLAAAHRMVSDEWRPEPAPLSLVFSEYASALRDHVGELSSTEVRQIFALIEQAVVSGSEEVRDATATCFLEALQSMASEGVLDFSRLDEHLGSRSRAFCLDWDRFTGVVTPGLSP